MKQIKSRAPNSSQAYISTETRIAAFNKLFDSPMAVEEVAVRHHDLESHRALSETVAKMVGGPTCKPVGTLTHTELNNLLYHAAFKFSRGQTTKSVLPMSKADELRVKKILGS